MNEREKVERVAKMIAVSESKLKSALILLENKQYDDVIGRAYYAAFLAASALLWDDGKSFSSHKGVLSEFNRLYVAPGLVPNELGSEFFDLQDGRHEGDYSGSFTISKGRADEGIAIASKILDACKKLLKDRGYNFNP